MSGYGQARRKGRPSVLRFVWFALFLHAGAGLLLRGAPGGGAVRPPALISDARELEVDLLEPATASPELAARTPESPPASPGVGQLAAARRPSTTGLGDAASAEADASPASDSEPSSLGEASSLGESEAAPAEPKLSRKELGIGDQNPWLDPRSAPRRSKPSAQARLQRSLTQAMVDRDQALGLGPAGPILTALHDVSLRELRVVNTAATLVALLDRDGKLIGLDVADVDVDHRSWQRVAQQTLARLQGKKLATGSGRQRTRITLRVESREQLPSSADPVPGVSLFGQTVKKGGGERAHRIDILKPELSLKTIEITGPGGEPIKVPELRVGVTLLGLPFEPVDLGARAQRVVSARVVKADVVPEPVQE